MMERIPPPIGHEVEVSVTANAAEKKVGKHALFSGITTRDGRTFVNVKRKPSKQEEDDIRRTAEA